MGSALADPALADPALVPPGAVVPPVTVPAAVVPPAVLPEDLVPVAVDPTLNETVIPPVLCSEPEAGAVVARASSGRTSSDSRQGTVPAASTPIGAAPVPVSADESPPAAPAGPPTPVRLPTPIPTPAPAGPTGPAGSSTTMSSGTSAYGTGQNQQTDSIDAVLDARVAISLAQAALRHTSGFAGAVVGGADDPGVRPG
jgi:hypothetical protein